MGSAWLCQHLWEHYAFSGDTDYLRRVWPTLKGAARFYLDYLMEEPRHRWLVTGPDTNFENSFRKPNGETRLHLHGADRRACRWCASCSRTAPRPARILGRTPTCARRSRRPCPGWPPMQISPTTGELQEWLEDWQRTAECQVLVELGRHLRHADHTRAVRPNWPRACGRSSTPASGGSTAWSASGRGRSRPTSMPGCSDGDTALAVFDAHLAEAESRI